MLALKKKKLATVDGVLMADKETIKREILRIAGNPSAGPIKELAEEWASALLLRSMRSRLKKPESLR
jgi:hypothetical protein